jgi:dTDP-4-amino-4,6-dideoxygalactose transaminase
MAFYYILRALDLPAGSEILFPALTFWVVPEIARVCGLRPVFVDIHSRTYNMDPSLIEAAITPQTRVIVPTHLYGLPCDMKPIMEIARKHRLKVIEDCAHALGATYCGVKAGAFGDAAFFSFQMLKGLNTYGGGMAIARDPQVAGRIRRLAESEPWPTARAVRKRIMLGEVLRGLTSPPGFTFSLFGPFYAASFFGNHDLSRFLWEKIRPLAPLPEHYRRRFSNAQAILGLKGLRALDDLNEICRANARRLTEGLSSIPSILTPTNVPDAVPVYYQYCIRASDPAVLSRRAIRKGIDIEMMHVDICNVLPLFADSARACPVAETTQNTLQLPVYSRLRPDDVERVLLIVREASQDLPPLLAALPGWSYR